MGILFPSNHFVAIGTSTLISTTMPFYTTTTTTAAAIPTLLALLLLFTLTQEKRVKTRATKPRRRGKRHRQRRNRQQKRSPGWVEKKKAYHKNLYKKRRVKHQFGVGYSSCNAGDGPVQIGDVSYDVITVTVKTPEGKEFNNAGQRRLSIEKFLRKEQGVIANVISARIVQKSNLVFLFTTTRIYENKEEVFRHLQRNFISNTVTSVIGSHEGKEPQKIKHR